MSEEQQTAIRDRLSLSEEELLVAIGDDLVGPQAFPLPPSELYERANRWLGAQYDRIEENICASRTLRKFVTADSDDYTIELRS